MSKKCSKCGEVKVLSAFVLCSYCKDGTRGYCKSCANSTERKKYTTKRTVNILRRIKAKAALRLAVKHTCKVCKEVKLRAEFSERPDRNVPYNKCKACANDYAMNRRGVFSGHSGFKPFLNEPTILYYVYFPEYSVYKIGITIVRNGIYSRFSRDKVKVTTIHTRVFEDGAEAFKEEQHILKKFKQYQYVGTPFLQGGNSELFYTNVLLKQ